MTRSTLTLDKIDSQFSKSVLRAFPEAKEEAHILLSRLFCSARHGHLCLEMEENEFDLIPEALAKRILHKEGSRLYLKRNWECESLFLRHLKRLSASLPELVMLESAEEEFLEHFSLESEQKAALKHVMGHTLTWISGGPGTGKTFTAAVLLQLFWKLTKGKIALAAPTGKATANLREKAKDLEEHVTIKTLHALLKSTHVLPFDLLIIDEASMIDASLMAKLFSSIKTGARLVLMGDKDQLPPVEAGHLFADLIVKEKKCVVELKTCRRTELKELVFLAQKVKNGEMIETLPMSAPSQIVTLLLSKMHEDFRLLTPLKKGIYGVDTLNALAWQEHERREGRNRSIPLMITENCEELGLYNGDLGMLTKDDQVLFKTGRILPLSLVPAYEPAYLLSVHKSQGSEYDEVAILLPKGAAHFGREMLYTALTRARKKVTLFCEEGELKELLEVRLQRLSGVCIR